MNLNFKSEVSKQQNDFDPLPEDRYTLKVIEGKYDLSKIKKTPQIALTLEVISEKYKNRKLWHNFTWTDKAAPVIYSFLKAIKSPLHDADNVEPEQLATGVVGGVFSAFVEIELTPSGNKRNKISRFNPVEGGEVPTGTNTEDSAPSNADGPKKSIFE
jgi:hypothetical protein